MQYTATAGSSFDQKSDKRRIASSRCDDPGIVVDTVVRLSSSAALLLVCHAISYPFLFVKIGLDSGTYFILLHHILPP